MAIRAPDGAKNVNSINSVNSAVYRAVLLRSMKLFFKVRLFPTKSLQVTARLENLSCLRLLSQTGERNAVKVNFFSMHISMFSFVTENCH